MTNHEAAPNATIRQTVEERLAQAKFKAEVRDARSHTARIRSALRELPAVLSEEGWNLDSDQQNLREVLQEIIGSAVHIADLLGVEL